LTWLDGRNNSSFGTITWEDDVLSFTITAANGSHNLRAMLPLDVDAGPLTTLTQDGNMVDFTTETIKGIEYAFFPANGGYYEAVYGSPNARLSSNASTLGSQLDSDEDRNKNKKFSLLVYPNPNSGEGFQVEAQGLQKQEEVMMVLYNPVGGIEESFIEVADDWGNVVKRLEFSNPLSNGVYILMLQGKTTTKMQKIIINR